MTLRVTGFFLILSAKYNACLHRHFSFAKVMQYFLPAKYLQNFFIKYFCQQNI